MNSTIRGRLRAWLPALTLGAAAFVFVTAEILPVGLLPDIARSLGKSEADTGLLLTVYAWGVALCGLPLTMLTASIDRRKLVLVVVALFICGNAFSAAAATFALLMAARICIAVAHSVFWAVIPPLSMRVAPEGGKAKALGITVTGTSLATVLGVPLGTLLGHWFGWRFTFGTVAALALALAVLMLRSLPAAPSTSGGGARRLSGIVRSGPLMRVYALTLLVTAGHFTAFTYFAPFMHTVGGFGSGAVAFLLLALGAAGIVGSVAGSRIVERPGRALIVIPLLGMCLLFAAMPPLVRGGIVPVCLLVIAWGVLYIFATMVLQYRVVVFSPACADQATAIFSGNFNIGVGLGAFVGSHVFASLGIGGIPYAGAAFLLLACVAGMPRIREEERQAEPGERDA